MQRGHIIAVIISCPETWDIAINISGTDISEIEHIDDIREDAQVRPAHRGALFQSKIEIVYVFPLNIAEKLEG